ncbi:MAG TPA: hypothetical protein VGR61_10615 [Candidatus Dormibacteraeota bacterium]|nr:hypothetical protein [Candidatus Dormibacteraeota bacterium]
MEAHAVRTDTYDLDGGECRDCLRLERTTDGWLVYHFEGGLKTHERYFGSEGEAAHYMAERLVGDPPPPE